MSCLNVMCFQLAIVLINYAPQGHIEYANEVKEVTTFALV